MTRWFGELSVCGEFFGAVLLTNCVLIWILSCFGLAGSSSGFVSGAGAGGRDRKSASSFSVSVCTVGTGAGCGGGCTGCGTVTGVGGGGVAFWTPLLMAASTRLAGMTSSTCVS